MTVRRLYLGCSLAALSAVSLLGVLPTSAQTAGDSSSNTGDAASNVETVTVTGSRISIQGYEAPTPVTVVNAEKLDRDSYLNIDQALVQLPSVGLSATQSNGVGAADLSQGDAGLSTVNLRNLGVDRTLVLFDGQRVVSSNLLDATEDIVLEVAGCINKLKAMTKIIVIFKGPNMLLWNKQIISCKHQGNWIFFSHC